MIITYQQAREAIAKYAGKAGKCAKELEVDYFVKEVIQELLFRGANGNLRKWVFYTQNGMFTAPPDLELPVKVNIGETSNFYKQAPQVYDKWYEFYDQSTLADCNPWEEGLVEEINNYFTAFDLPECGSRILAVPFCQEDEDAQFIIQGIDDCGKEIYMPHKGERFKGEVLSISKQSPKYTQKVFTQITGIQKTPTKHYVRLYSYNPETQEKSLLAEYKPGDTNPSFRRFRVLSQDCSRCFKVSLLGRIRFCEHYHDNDIIPISNLRALKLMAQQIQAEDNDNIQIANYKNQRIEQSINSENQYKRTPEAAVDTALVVAPSSVKNLI